MQVCDACDEFDLQAAKTRHEDREKALGNAGSVA